MISGFGNGTEDRKKLAKEIMLPVEKAAKCQVRCVLFVNILISTHPPQVLFVLGNNLLQPVLTPKYLVARAKRIPILDSSFLVSWQTRGRMPDENR